MNNKKTGQLICELRKELGFSQKELAEKLSVTDKAVSKWETGRGMPDISILQPLAEVLDVSVNEILNGERMPEQTKADDERLIKKLKIKKYIRLAAEILITAVAFYQLYIFKETFDFYRNVVDMYLHRNEIEFLSIATLIYIAAIVLWLIIVIVSAALKKDAPILKTVAICLTISFVVGSSVHMAVLEDNRYSQLYDKPVDTVRYIKYDDFFDDAFETQITIKDTNQYITENYSVFFTAIGDENHFVNTKCMTCSTYDITEKYYNECKALSVKNDNYVDMSNALCKTLGVTAGYYVTNHYTQGDIELCFIKDLSCFQIDISDTNITSELLLDKISTL